MSEFIKKVKKDGNVRNIDEAFKEYSQKVLLSLNETGKVNAEIVILKKHIYK